MAGALLNLEIVSKPWNTPPWALEGNSRASAVSLSLCNDLLLGACMYSVSAIILAVAVARQYKWSTISMSEVGLLPVE